MKSYQSGSVLVVSLLLLLIITIVGVSGVSNSLLGERLAANQKQISEAMMKAESGLVSSHNFFMIPTNIAKWPTTDTSWSADKVKLEGLKDNVVTGLHWYIDSISFVSNRALVVSCGIHNGSGVKRCIQSIMQRGSGEGNLAAMNIIGTIKNMTAASSSQFKIVGEMISGSVVAPAIATNTEGNVQKILDSTKDSREANYVGGVKQVEFTGPFGDANEMRLFIDTVKAECAITNNCLNETNINNKSFPTAASKIYILKCPASCELAGNTTGKGILIVEGNVVFSGQATFDGLVIVTGSQVRLNGLGNNGLRGTLVVAHMVENKVAGGPSDWTFGSAEATIDLDLKGGGNAKIEFNRQLVAEARELLGAGAKDLWQFTDTNNGSVGSGSTSIRVTSWSEVN
ncbi:hypothetical protein GCM10010919_27340 [Alishewanella longhuensis]|uniref:Type 4 fimbrial biogenesis protein PilX N-terminal domain-containing protein n=1 Tax=Alishewanella longhuensis TaxID=1091037 RepID=A0ABQ3L2L4_9ALTE|nr:PilX N-terminal domain-containing pilus assembly protein [Alishewanella longhuensis]GHG74010.1 hypothetical protein GCM10010919_27340 [Alishewanella longhuensis]